MANQAELVNALDRDRAKNHFACVVLASIVVMVVSVLNFPYDYVQVGERWVGISEDDEGRRSIQITEMPRMAGWPFRYWVQYRHKGVMETRYWSGNKLAFNVAIGLCLAAFVYGFMQLRNWRIGQARNARLTRTLFDCGIALAILGIPAMLVALENRKAGEHWRLASQLATRGNCQLACWFPSPLAEHVPEGLLRTFARLRQVTLSNASDDLVRSAAETSSLVAIDSTRGDFDSSAIEPLVDNIHFLGLRLTDRNLSDADVDVIARLRWLGVLSLSRTNLDSRMLRRLDHLDHLRSVNLSETPLDLEDLGRPQWAEHVETLQLSRPLRGTGSVSIDDWQNLRLLRIERFSTRLNDDVLTVRLSNLPSLKELQLNRVQKHHLVIRNAPRLTTIDEGLSELQESLGMEAYVPGLTWVNSLEIDGAESLTRLGCFARDLEHLSIRNVSSLRSFSLGSYLISAFSESRPEAVDPDRCRQWIQRLGSWDGPSKIDLTGLPLSEIDLAPLRGNSRVRELVLRDSGVTIDQLKQLEGMTGIERLDARSTSLHQDDLSWLLKRFPNLQDISIDGTRLETFSVSDNDTLRRIRLTRLDHATDVRVVEVPRLHVGLRMSQTPARLEIRNAPALVGIAIEGSWPAAAEIGGLRKLEWFAAGGPAINDDLLDVLLPCGDLDQLTLAYGSISREKLKEIGKFPKLSLLSLPGADVDDEVTENWHDLKSLWEINLDDTSVSVGTIAWLSSIESLRRVSFNRVRFNDAAADALSHLSQLGELQLGGTSMDPNKLRPLLAKRHLDTLDLSGWPLDEDLVDVLQEARSLRYLVLRDSEIEPRSLDRLMASNTSLFIDMGVRPEQIDAQLASELQRRASRVQRVLRVGWRQPMGLADRYDGTAESPLRLSLYQQSDGRIDTNAFRPVVLADPGGN